MHRAATHLFRRKNLCREHGEGEKQTKSTPQRTTRYDHTTHHNRTKQNTHTHTRQHYQHTKPHTIPQTPYATPHTTKALPQKRRKSFIEIYQGQLGLEPTGFPSLPEAKTSYCPKQLYSPGPTSSKHRPDSLTLEPPREGRGAEDGGI